MGKIGSGSTISEGEKSQLVLEICSLSTIPIVCSHKRHFNNTVKSHFIDWYRLLGVAENSGFELIKRRYHKLALQLHPDKNKHPKAEVAFKLVSEAYACLSDNMKRRAFNIERWKHFCNECNRIPYSTDKSLLNSQTSSNPKNSGKFLQSLKGIRDRFKEEIRVIENCLRVNRMSRKESPTFKPSANSVGGHESRIKHKIERESPVFEPPEYGIQGYPHLRDQILNKSERFWELQRRSVEEGGKYHSPVFQNSSSQTGGMFRGMIKSRSVCIHS
ncbi:hypothetical protein E1A91_D09G077800v1 [Gossypium mustelinum]|uniref:J domain-containing protein n=1 Tax=Gossypium mustelinum TaxID=34275 RepID=A0A5D2THV7_GOSMU|nr:hypothetical protein E1A91_D09G077800v1 [Gossypium mustelinum]